MRQFYDDNPDLYTKKATVKAQVMILPSEEDALLALKRYNEGESFSDLAAELSIDENTRKFKGEIGTIKSDSKRVPESVISVMFSLMEGGISEPIETKDGFVIVRVKEKTEAENIPYDIFKDWTRKRALERKVENARLEYFKQIQGDDEIVMIKENVSKLVEEIKDLQKQNMAAPPPSGHSGLQ